MIDSMLFSRSDAQIGDKIYADSQEIGFMNNQDIVILCSPRLAQGMSEAFKTQIVEQELPTFVVWSGTSAKYRQGIVVLEWEGPVPTDFVTQLDIDADVIDYVIYEVPTVETDSASTEREKL